MSADLILAHLASSPLAIIGWDADSRVIRWEGAAEGLFGWTAAEVLGRRFAELDIIFDEDLPLVRAVMSRLTSGREPTVVSVNRNWTKQRAIKYCEWHHTVLTDREGRMSSVLSFVVDRTAQRGAEEQLHRSRERFRVLADAGQKLGSSLDFERTLNAVADLLVNSGIGESCAISVAGASGSLQRVALVHRDAGMRDVMEVLRSYSPASEANQAHRAFKERRTIVSEEVTSELLARLAVDARHLEALRRLGARAFVAVPLLHQERAIGALLVSTADESVTYDAETVALVEELARRCAAAIAHAQLFADERRLRLEREQVAGRLSLLQRISNALSHAMGTADAAKAAVELVVPHLDACAGAVLLRDRDEVVTVATVGYPAELVATYGRFPVGDCNPVSEVIRKGTAVFFDDQKAHAAVYPHLAHGATVAGFQALAVVPLRWGGEVLGALALRFRSARVFTAEDRGLLESVAEQCAQSLARARAFERERVAREEADRASRAKDEFLAVLGHELRNPLAPIITALHLLELKGASKESAVIGRQVAHLKRLVDDLLDVSRVSRGALELRRMPLDLREVVEAAVEAMDPLVHQRGHKVTLDLSDAPLPVRGDRERLVQVFANILVNAAKYTPPGGTIRVAGVRVRDRIELSVRDSGAGLSKEMLDRVFDMFVQAPQPRDRAQGGLGLGLAIVKRLVQLHDGLVAADSEGPGRGSTFTVTLPAHDGAAVEVAPVTPSSTMRVRGRVLIVDDNQDAADMLAGVLGERGYEVRTADDAPTALVVAREFQPAVALLDIGLPVVDGYQLAGMLLETVGRFPIVAISGYSQPHDIDRSKRAGFRAHLVKPVDVPALLKELERIEAASLAGMTDP